MVIARLTNEALVLGLSHENLRRLQAGEPIRLTQESHPGCGLPEFPILIVAGATEQAIVDDLRSRMPLAH